MDEAQRVAAWRHLMRSTTLGELTKADVRAAVDACAGCRDEASFRAALPQPFRGTASAADKARLFELVRGDQ